MDVKELRIDWFFTWFGLCGGAGRAMFDLLVSRLGLPVRRLMSETITHVMTTEALISALGRIINYLTFNMKKLLSMAIAGRIGLRLTVDGSFSLPLHGAEKLIIATGDLSL